MRLIWIMLLLVQPVLAGHGFADGNPQQGKALYAPCASCHGAQGGGNAELGAPRLTHLPPVYVIAQLQKFQAGARGGPDAGAGAQQMAAMAATLPTEEAIYDVAAYIATLQGQVSAVTVEGDIELGRDYYIQFCGACHGAGAVGNPALNSPPLAGADDWYLAAQLQAFRDGARGTQPQDRTGKQMRMMAGTLPDDAAIAAVVAYIRSLDQ